MKYFDINDLSLIAKIRSDLLFVLSQLDSGSYTNEETAEELRKVVVDIFDFEKGIHDEFFSNNDDLDS